MCIADQVHLKALLLRARSFKHKALPIDIHLCSRIKETKPSATAFWMLSISSLGLVRLEVNTLNPLCPDGRFDLTTHKMACFGLLASSDCQRYTMTGMSFAISCGVCGIGFDQCLTAVRSAMAARHSCRLLLHCRATHTKLRINVRRNFGMLSDVQ